MAKSREQLQQDYEAELTGDLDGLAAVVKDESKSGEDVLMVLVDTLRRAHLRPTVSEREIFQNGTIKEKLDTAAKIAVEAILHRPSKEPDLKRDVSFGFGNGRRTKRARPLVLPLGV
jgi:hypothetical protein